MPNAEINLASLFEQQRRRISKEAGYDVARHKPRDQTLPAWPHCLGERIADKIVFCFYSKTPQQAYALRDDFKFFARYYSRVVMKVIIYKWVIYKNRFIVHKTNNIASLIVFFCEHYDIPINLMSFTESLVYCT